MKKKLEVVVKSRDGDRRYDYVKCPACGGEYQRLDFGCQVHGIVCDYPYGRKLR